MSNITIKIKETVNYDDLNEREKALYDEGHSDGYDEGYKDGENKVLPFVFMLTFGAFSLFILLLTR